MRFRKLIAPTLLIALLIASCASAPIVTTIDPLPCPRKANYTAEELDQVPTSVLRKLLAYEEKVDGYCQGTNDRIAVHNGQ